MSKINEVALLVVNDLVNQGDTEAAVDPATIALIADFIFKLIEKFKECREDANDAEAMMRSPSRIQMIVINNVARSQMGLREFRNSGRQIVRSTLDVGKRLSSQEFLEMYEEV